MVVWPARMVALPNGDSVFLFTVIQADVYPKQNFRLSWNLLNERC